MVIFFFIFSSLALVCLYRMRNWEREGVEAAGGGVPNVIPQHEATHAQKKRMKRSATNIRNHSVVDPFSLLSLFVAANLCFLASAD